MNDLAAILKYHRKELGISQSGLARLSGVHVKTIARLETGQARVNLAILPALLDALNVSTATRLRLMGVE